MTKKKKAKKDSTKLSGRALKKKLARAKKSGVK